MKFLVGYDGTESAHRALTLAAEQARAVDALVYVVTSMEGGEKESWEEIKAAERKWNNNVKLNNVELVEKETGVKVELLENEQSLELSKKRKEIYEK